MSGGLNLASTCGLLSAPSKFTVKTEEYPLAELPQAMEAAATAGNLECIVVQP